MEDLPVASEPDKTTGLPSSTAIIWQEWTQKHAQNAPTLEQVQEITKKVKLNVTHTILEDQKI
ncbi:MAG: hypothetical protein OXH16_02750 [Gemmatimonadetes bacterium]|nr:hypothetical protein [Gemmatimonadota bacterium]